LIIFFESGRLGNQLFQLSFLLNYDKGKVVIFGMNQLNNYFYAKNIIFIKKRNNRILNFLIFKLFKFFITLISYNLRLINYIKESNDNNLVFRNGLFKSLYYCDESYFQSEIYITTNFLSKIKLKDKYLHKAYDIINNHKKGYDKIFFIHIRRGDYLFWPTIKNPASININWYLKQISFLQDLYDNSLFLIISDDKDYINTEFKEIRNCKIIDYYEPLEFGIMSICDGGVLSASTFAYWASRFSYRNNNNNIYIAPLYWVGHSTGLWNPVNIKSSWLTYKEVII